MEAVGGSALAIGSIGGVIYLTPEPPAASATTTRLGAPTNPSNKAPVAPAFSSLGAPLAALVEAALLLLVAVLLTNRGKRGGRARLGPLLDVGGAEQAAAQEGEEGERDDDPMRYHALLPSTVVEGGAVG